MTEKTFIFEGPAHVAYKVVLVDPATGLPVSPTGGGGGSSADREVVVSTYRAKTASAGNYAVGDTITSTRVLDVSGASPAQVGATVWVNETSGSVLGAAPSAAHLTLTGSGGATDAEMRATPIGVIPSMASGGNTSAQTAATGTNWVAFAAQACKRLTLANNTGAKVEFRQGGAGVGDVVFDGGYFVIEGVTNASQVEVRRVDTSNTQVTIAARWEA